MNPLEKYLPKKKEPIYSESAGITVNKKSFEFGKQIGHNKAINLCLASLPKGLDEKNIQKEIFTFLHKRKLSNTYRNPCGICLDGCANCDGTGYILNELGTALIVLSTALCEAYDKGELFPNAVERKK